MRAILSIFLASLFFISASAFSQSPNGTISGIVVDQAGAVIVGAEVLIANDATGVQYIARTNSEGLYVVSNLPPGAYRIQVSNSGFKTIIKPAIVIHVQDALAINFTLPIGAASEVLTVTAGTPLINTESASVGTVIDRNFAEQLPLNGRSFNTLLQLTPGVTIVANANRQGSQGQFSINGQRTDANSFQVDGVSANFGSGPNATLNQAGGGGTQAFNAYGGTSSLVSVDALQEFRVETSSYAPEFGRTPGGQIIISTRSGTNQFHGDAFDYFRNDVLDANDWFANAAGKPRAPERQNDFGGVFGGPIFRDKTFFFLSYEGLRLRQPQAMIIQVPSLAWRASATNPKAAAILNAYPKPVSNAPVTSDGNASPFTGVWSNQITMDAVSLRIDHSFSGHLTVFGRYNRSPSQNSFRFLSLSSIFDQEVDTTTFTTGANWVVSGNMSDSLRFNYSKQRASGLNRLDNFGGAIAPSATTLMPAGTSVSDSLADFNPSFIGNPLGADHLQSLSLGQTANNRISQWNAVDDFTVIKGTHQLKFGADYRRLPIEQTGQKSSINYVPVGAPFGPADPAAQFASNATVTLAVNNLFKPASFYFQSFSAYAQDRSMIGKRVTLTYGMRWELNPPPSPDGGTFLASWLNVDKPSQIALASRGTAVWKTTYSNFAPRIGIAWRVTKSGDLVVRGGWGIFYDLGTAVASNLGAAFPNTALFFGIGAFPVPITNTAAITPTVSLQPPYTNQSFITAISPNLQLPYSQQWNLAIEKSLWNRQSVSFTYLGQMGRRLLRTESLLDPNSNFVNSSFTLTRNGDTSDYHALQVQFRRPLSERVQALLNYTWSHSIDTNSDDGVPTISHFALSVPGERGSSNFDVRQAFSGAVTLEPPAFGRSLFLRRLTEGWSFNTVVQARTGFPLNIFTVSVPIPGQTQASETRPDVVPGVPIWISDAGAPGGKRLNAAAFALPSTSRQGTLGRNAFAGFGATQVDASLARRFAFTEKLSLQFRADVFNILNHPNFSTTDDSFGQFPAGLEFGRATQMLNRGLGGLNPLYQIGGPRSIQLSLKWLF